MMEDLFRKIVELLPLFLVLVAEDLTFTNRDVVQGRDFVEVVVEEGTSSTAAAAAADVAAIALLVSLSTVVFSTGTRTREVHRGRFGHKSCDDKDQDNREAREDFHTEGGVGGGVGKEKETSPLTRHHVIIPAETCCLSARTHESEQVETERGVIVSPATRAASVMGGIACASVSAFRAFGATRIN